MSLDNIEGILNGMDAKSIDERFKIVRDTGMCSVCLFAESKTKNGVRLDFTGSGTLVSVESSHFILTARHVWDEILKSASRLGITLRIKDDHSFFIDTMAIIPFGPPGLEKWSESGPDIILLRIPDIHVGTIKAFRVFYNLTIPESSAPRADYLETWFLMGAPGCLGEYTQTHASIQNRGQEVVVKSTFENLNFDYLDVMVKVSDLPRTKTLGGVSGGGLWKVLLFDSPSDGGIESIAILRGIAFCEFPLLNDNRVVRCHGIESIRSIAREIGRAK